MVELERRSIRVYTNSRWPALGRPTARRTNVWWLGSFTQKQLVDVAHKVGEPLVVGRSSTAVVDSADIDSVDESNRCGVLGCVEWAIATSGIVLYTAAVCYDFVLLCCNLQVHPETVIFRSVTREQIGSILDNARLLPSCEINALSFDVPSCLSSYLMGPAGRSILLFICLLLWVSQRDSVPMNFNWIYYAKSVERESESREESIRYK